MEIVKPVPILGIFKDSATKKKKILYKEQGWGDVSVDHLLKNLDFHLSKIPDHSKKDLFFTIAETKNGEVDREMVVQRYVVFDIDKIDQLKKSEVAQAVCDFLKVPFEKTLTIFTGGGLHIGIKLKNPITSLSDLEKMQLPFSYACEGITNYLKNKGLAGFADPQMLTQGKMFRLPKTYNTKYGTSGILTEVLNQSFDEVDFDVMSFSGKPGTDKKKVDKDYVAVTPGNVDVVAVTTECSFLQYTEKNAAHLSEPEWFADIGIRAFLPNGKKEIHRIHSAYPQYSREETESKIDNILQNQTGPRRCQSIARTTGFDCSKCIHFRKVISPIQVKGPEFIATRESGFRVPNAKKPMDKWEIAYADLLKFFKESFTYFTDTESGRVFVYKDNFWQHVQDSELLNWAFNQIHPISKRSERLEFVNSLKDANQRTQSALHLSTFKKVNLRNGVYCATTRSLLPHSADFGFKYILPYEYNPTAKCDRFDRFLVEVLPEDEGNQKAILEYVAYALFNDDCWLQTALFLQGEGSNGKSTLLRTIAALAGKDNILSMNLSSVMEKDTKRAMLENKLFCMSEETRAAALLESEMFKILVDGGVVDAKQIYIKDYTFTNRAKFMLSFNSFATSRDKTHALYRRMRKIPFNQRFAIDQTLEPALSQELSGIFNRIVEAYARLHEQKTLTHSEISVKALADFKQKNDPVFEFLEEEYEIIDDEHTYVELNLLYREFTSWFDDQGYERRFRPDSKSFRGSVQRHMGKFYDEYRPRSNGGDRPRSLRNLKKKRIDR